MATSRSRDRARRSASGLLLRAVPFPIALAARYLRSSRRDAFVSFLSAVAAGGLALGVAALVLSLAALSGFQGVLISQLLARSPQLDVELPAGADAEAARAAVQALPGVRAVQVQISGQGWLVGPGRRAQPVDLVGFEGRVPSSFPGAAGRPEGVYVADGLAAAWDLAAGDRVEVVSPRPTLTPFGPQPRMRSAVVAGTFEGAPSRDERQRVALPLPLAASLLGGVVRHLELEVGGFDRAAALAGRVAAALPAGSRVRTWRDLNRPLVFVLRLEKGMMFVSVFLIVLVAALALVADLALVIANKRGEIGMLGAMGATPGSLSRAFLALGAALAALGVGLGVTVGVTAAEILDRYRLLRVPAGVYFLDYVPFVVQGHDLAAVVAASFAVALASSWYAAKRAAALTPVEALRR